MLRDGLEMIKSFWNDTLSFDPRTPWIGYGRTIIALGQVSILLFAPPDALFAPVLGRPPAPYCDGLKQASLFCVSQGTLDPEVTRWGLLAVLVLVAAGIVPRWTVIPHAWISFSLAQSLALPDGGENVAQIITALLIPLGLADDRRWHWKLPSTPRDIGSKTFAVTLGFSVCIRLQLAAIYINSGLAKLGTDAWVEGTAEYYIARSKSFGITGFLEPAFLWFTSVPAGTAVLTWGTILLECSLAFLIMGTARSRFVGFLLGTLLHLGIIATIGLWSFGLIMIGTLCIATSPGTANVCSIVDSNRLLTSIKRAMGIRVKHEQPYASGS